MNLLIVISSPVLVSCGVSRASELISTATSNQVSTCFGKARIRSGTRAQAIGFGNGYNFRSELAPRALRGLRLPDLSSAKMLEDLLLTGGAAGMVMTWPERPEIRAGEGASEAVERK